MENYVTHVTAIVIILACNTSNRIRKEKVDFSYHFL